LHQSTAAPGPTVPSMNLRPVVVVIVSAVTDAWVNATGEQVGAATLSRHPLTAGSSARNGSNRVRIRGHGFLGRVGRLNQDIRKRAQASFQGSPGSILGQSGRPVRLRVIREGLDEFPPGECGGRTDFSCDERGYWDVTDRRVYELNRLSHATSCRAAVSHPLHRRHTSEAASADWPARRPDSPESEVGREVTT
jgi:hypothetical protein